VSQWYPVEVDSAVGSNASVVALNVGPTGPQRSLARNDSNATYIEGETLTIHE
jgi:hypothetical protein